MAMRWQLFPRSLAPPPAILDLVAAFRAASGVIETPSHQLDSNEVLDAVRPHLEAIGYQVEQPGPPRRRIDRPVLFGEGGRPMKSFQVDAWHEETGTVVEVEAGRAVVNHQFLKDLFEACAIQDARWLAIAVANAYHPKSQARPADDFATVTTFIDTLYASGRLTLPLEGVLIVGY
jgi:hypothetical protein